MYLKTVIILFFLMQGITTWSQDFDHHQWQDRLVLLFADDRQNPILQEQLAVFEKDQAGLLERKILIFKISPKVADLGKGPIKDTTWIKAQYQSFQIKEGQFTMLLIGLDGGEKLRRTTAISLKELFAIIDGMPMRRQELRKQ